MVKRFIQYFCLPDRPIKGGGHLGFLGNLRNERGVRPPYQLCWIHAYLRDDLYISIVVKFSWHTMAAKVKHTCALIESVHVCSSCDDASGVPIPSTTWYSQQYRVEPSYTEYGVEYFCYSGKIIRCRIFLLFRVGYAE